MPTSVRSGSVAGSGQFFNNLESSHPGHGGPNTSGRTKPSGQLRFQIEDTLVRTDRYRDGHTHMPTSELPRISYSPRHAAICRPSGSIPMTRSCRTESDSRSTCCSRGRNSVTAPCYPQGARAPPWARLGLSMPEPARDTTRGTRVSSGVVNPPLAGSGHAGLLIVYNFNRTGCVDA